MPSHSERLVNARISLEGLSIGDALGGFLEGNHRAKKSHIVVNRKPPKVEWHFTDDTNMALSIYAILCEYSEINQDALATHFAKYYDPKRGYGAGAGMLLRNIKKGSKWQVIAPMLFNGGSYGNGGAMRVALVGAYFADDIQAVVHNARLSSEITHAHPEGIAGAIAIAVAAAVATNLKGKSKPTRSDFISEILQYIPESDVKTGIEIVQTITNADISEVVELVGNGSYVSAQDTVPFALFCASEWLDNYEEAIWQTMSGGGDVDTTCAMVGGIVACYVGQEGIPSKWINQREKLPQWAFEG